MPLAALMSIPVTFLIFVAVRYVAAKGREIKHWPPNYWM
jgi:hypothetical protein